MQQNIEITKIIRSKRRTLCLQINDDAELIVRAPIRLPEKFIYDFVQKKSSWILKKQHLAFDRYKNQLKKQYINGEEFYYCGRKVQLVICENKEINLTSNFLFFPQKFLSNPEPYLLAWYKNAAKDKITERVLKYSANTGLKYNSIKLSNAKKRWGSCSSKNNLNFNWRLILLPEEILDYVIIHEIAHLAVKNHSKEFWNLVATIYPNYKNARKYLNLALISW